MPKKRTVRKSVAKTVSKSVDPELERQLAEASEEAPVQAVFTLRTQAGKVRAAAATQQVVDKVVKKAASAAKTAPHRLTVFPNLDSFAVSGSPAFVRRVLEDPDIATAIANRQRQDMLIRPVKSKRLKAKKKR